MIAKVSSRPPSPVSAEMIKVFSGSRKPGWRTPTGRPGPPVTLLRCDQIDLVQYQPAWLAIQRLVVLAQFFDNGARIIRGIRVLVEWGDVHQVQQQSGSLQMAQELMAKACAFGSAFDQARYVRDHETAVFVHAHHAEIRVQRGKGVVRDFRPCRGDGADIGRFAGIRHAEQADVGQNLELELQTATLARRAWRTLARRAVGARLEMNVAQASLPAFCQHCGLAVGGQVGERFTGLDIAYHGADRKTQSDVVRGLAVAVGAATFFAVARAMNAGKAILDQGIDVAIGHGKNAAAATAIAAVRAAARNEFLAPETGDAVPAFSGVDFDGGFVDEFHVSISTICRQDAKSAREIQNRLKLISKYPSRELHR